MLFAQTSATYAPLRSATVGWARLRSLVNKPVPTVTAIISSVYWNKFCIGVRAQTGPRPDLSTMPRYYARRHRSFKARLPRVPLRSFKGALARVRKRRKGAYRRGYMRTAGFYGRFAGPSAELKFHDLAVDDAVVAVNGTIIDNSVNNIPQGTTEITRIGRKCTIRSINWRFSMQLLTEANTATPGVDTVRVIMYLDKQCNGAAATVTDILESDNYHSFNNLANKSRFRTLMDRTYTFSHPCASGADATAEWGPEKQDDTFFKNVNIPIEFDGTAGALTEIRSNNIGVMLLSQAGLCNFTSEIRLRFSDAG